MADKRQQAARDFAEYWRGKGYEKGESQPFWMSLLRDVYGVEHPEQYISFEDQVKLDHTSFIDGYIDKTKVMIEQKGSHKNLGDAIRQSDGSLLTPFQQAKRYIVELPVDKHPRYVITCNFKEFWVYDMNRPTGDPEKILLEDLPNEYYRLEFLVNSASDHLQRELELSVKAGSIVGQLYDAFAKQYADPTSPMAMRSLNVLCVRLVFCLYAENAGIFGRYGIFHDYMKAFRTNEMRRALVELFRILDTKMEDRDHYLATDNPLLATFPYVNGGLFADENIDIPPFTEEIRTLLLHEASEGFNWKDISPTIFGAVFESTLNPDTRRSGGMHYTSIENINKVINPLFMDSLRDEFGEICDITVIRTRDKRLTEFQQQLSTLTFLDPACGSGNFLTESYLSLRRLENDVLRLLYDNKEMVLGRDFKEIIQVKPDHFYGIEINDFAVAVARTALWIAEHQMMEQTKTIVQEDLDFLPLKSYTNIIEGNALRIDWESVVTKEQLNYIMGNPPFVGYSLQSREQKEEMLSIYVDERGKPYKTAGKIDYVSAWYFKASQMMQGTSIRAALVSTNSITQGEQVAAVWKPLYDRFRIHIDFAYRTFRWDSEASLKAHVHCVIVGFSTAPNNKPKIIYDGDRLQEATNINGYLMDAPNVYVESRRKPLLKVAEMVIGNLPRDGGNFIITADEYDDFIKKEPLAQKFIRPYLGAEEFIKGKKRYCLWLVNASPQELTQMPHVLKRIEAVRTFRQASTREMTRKMADFPTLFAEVRQPESNYIVIPETSSERRRYVPIGFMEKEIIASNLLFLIPDADLYHFGVLTSNIHMAWMRAVCGRLEMRYRYSGVVVYNNFPWPEPTEEQRAKIEETARAILDARALYPDASLADLYDETTMPIELRRAHQENDRAVMTAYGWTKNDPQYKSEAACVAQLMNLYQALTNNT